MKNSSTSAFKLTPFLGKGLAFLGGLFLLVLGLNHVGKPARENQDIWYGPVVDYMKQGGRFHFLFVGTSRTRAAIRPDVFDTLMQQVYKTPTVSINLGMGWCRLSEHYFGLRHLLEVNPDILRNVVVFIEAPASIPEYSTWKSDWIVQDRTDLLTPYMHSKDLWNLWRNSTTETSMKFVITANLIAPFMENIPRLRQNALPKLDTLLQSLFTPLTNLGAREKEAPEYSDLITEGGIRNDKKGVETAKDLAIRIAKEDTEKQEPWNHFDASIVAEIHHMVKNAGGYVLFLDMPLSNVQQVPYDTELRKRERKQFNDSTLKKWDAIMLHPKFSYDTTDFPDLWHLRKTRAPEFTYAVANSFVAALQASGPK